MKSLLNRIVTSLVVFFFGFTLLVNAQGGATQQATGAFSSLKTIIESFSSDVLAALGTLFMGAAVVIFFLGIVQYIWGLREGDPKKVSAGNQFMMWGLVGLFVMFSVYGIVKWGQEIFFGKDANITTIAIPQVKFNTTGGAPSTSGPLGDQCEILSGSCVDKQACKKSNGSNGICENPGGRSLSRCCS